MASSQQEEIEDGTTQSDGSDITDVLSNSEETEFVTGEEKAPVNRTSLMLFGVLLVGAAGYMFMYSKSGPASAAAATTAEAQAADQTISQFLSAGEENIRVMRQLRMTTDKVVAQFRNTEVAQVPVGELQANPFKFAQISDDASAAAEAAKKREEEKQAVLKSVQTLQLQSILHGAKPTCMVNNQMYTEGQQVGSFTIEKISTNAVIVRSGEHRFQLKMQR